MTDRITIGLIIDIPAEHRYHAASRDAVHHAAAGRGGSVEVRHLPTASLTTEALAEVDGLFIGPGSPYDDVDAALDAIRHGRESGIPMVGT